MKKALLLASCLFLASCAHDGGGGIRDIPDAPGDGPEIIKEDVPIPVMCQVTVTAPALDINTVPEDAPLEEQNAGLRGTIGQQATYIIDLTAALLGCGGKIVNSNN